MSQQPMIGDELKYYGSDDVFTVSRIKQIGWRQTPNGGKVLIYTTERDDEVESAKIIGFDSEARSVRVNIKEPLELTGHSRLKERFFADLQSLVSNPSVRTAISCAVQGDWENLEVAAFLLKSRAKELRELAFPSES